MNLLPDWPEAKVRMQRRLERQIHEVAMANAPLGSQVKRIHVTEGDRIILVKADGSEREMEFLERSASAIIEPERSRTEPWMIPNRVAEDLGKQLGEQMERELMELALSDDSGAMTRVSMGESDEDIRTEFLAGLKNAMTSFSPSGEPQTIIVVHPETGRLLQSYLERHPEEANADAEVEAIKEEKRREWLAREANRRLVD